MGINAIQSFKEMSTGKKVATVAAGVAATAAVASAVAAGVKGKKIVTDDFVKGLGLKNGENAIEKVSDLKFFKKAGLILSNGYKEIGNNIKETSVKAFNAVKNFFKKGNKPEGK